MSNPFYYKESIHTERVLGRAKEWARQTKHSFIDWTKPDNINLAAEIEIVYFRNVQTAREEALSGGLGMAGAVGLDPTPAQETKSRTLALLASRRAV